MVSGVPSILPNAASCTVDQPDCSRSTESRSTASPANRSYGSSGGGWLVISSIGSARVAGCAEVAANDTTPGAFKAAAFCAFNGGSDGTTGERHADERQADAGSRQRGGAARHARG